MASHLFRGICFAAALACVTSPAVGLAASVTVEGTDSGVFVNSSPAASPGGVHVTGLGSSHFTYGTGTDGSGPNSLTYTPVGTISSMSETPFKLGTLTYFNGTVSSGSVPNSVDLKITLSLTTPSGIPPVNFNFTLGLYSTPNDGNANQNADYVYFPSSFSSTIFTVEGVAYTLKLTGFENVIGDGFLTSSSSQLHVREQGTATAELYGMVTTDTSGVVPEPASIVSGAVACLFGLFGLSRRSRKAAHA